MRIAPKSKSAYFISNDEELRCRSSQLYTTLLQDNFILLRHSVYSHLQSLRTYFYNSINNYEDQFDEMFTRTYGSLYTSNKEIFSVFFSRLRTFSSPTSTIDISRATHQLFLQMFHTMFTLLNPLLKVSDAERSCIESHFSTLAPFGDIPNRLSSLLSPSLNHFRLLLHSLDSTYDMLDGFFNISSTPSCLHSFTRLHSCSLCSNLLSKPCASSCISVVSSCLSEFRLVHGNWIELIDSLRSLSSLLQETYNVQHALNPISAIVSEAVMSFQEKADIVSNKVISRCLSANSVMEEFDLPYRRKRETIRRDTGALRWIRDAERQRQSGARIYAQIVAALHNRLRELRNFFNDIPSDICVKHNTSEVPGKRCWNGKVEVEESEAGKESHAVEIEKHIYRGQFVEQRMKMNWISAKIRTKLNGKDYPFEGSGDDEDYIFSSYRLEMISMIPQGPSFLNPTVAIIQYSYRYY
ncbi:hypothetical protein WR25_23974 [Diploscapter pachys]|uniref:Uncharacterized protein n=1 Tax=Diploscapter pachys TaxID=2018661 RepID=A0A2A2L7B9_9BILA|nr:hypothetical protein WR25_23974 [Diploscapter pachys]